MTRERYLFRGGPCPRKRRALGLSACAFCLLACATASAQLERSTLKLGTQLELDVLSGYPRALHTLHAPITLGFVARNRGPEREIQLEIDGEVRATRTLRVAAGETRRNFVYLPALAWGSRPLKVTAIDRLAGGRKQVELRPSVQGNETLARLGGLSHALNVSDPWTMVGALDGYMPDDWRGLNGLRAIVMEAERFADLGAERAVLIDWVVSGGLLLIASSPEQAETAAETALPFARAPELTELGLRLGVGHGAIVYVPPAALAEVDDVFFDNVVPCPSCRFSAEQAAHAVLYEEVLQERLRATGAAPRAALLGLLAAFSLLVGPIGWRALVTRRRKPLRYIAFVVATGALFSAGVVAADTLAQGLDPKGVCHSLLLIDQRSGSELGIEELAIYPPASRGTALDMPARFAPLLPHSVLRSPRLDVRFAEDRQRVEGALEVRFRQVVGARWLGRAHGELLVSAQDGALTLENHLGDDLESVVVWHEGRTYLATDLARGQAAQAAPVELADALAALPALPGGLLVAQGETLAAAVQDGQLGVHRYYGAFDRPQRRSRLIADALVPVAPGVHLVAGIYR